MVVAICRRDVGNAIVVEIGHGGRAGEFTRRVGSDGAEETGLDRRSNDEARKQQKASKTELRHEIPFVSQVRWSTSCPRIEGDLRLLGQALTPFERGMSNLSSSLPNDCSRLRPLRKGQLFPTLS